MHPVPKMCTKDGDEHAWLVSGRRTACKERNNLGNVRDMPKALTAKGIIAAANL